MQDAQPGSTIRKLAIIGNHLPRRCGIATFTTDLGKALAQQFSDLETLVLAMNDGGHRYAYPERVRFELGENDVAAYRRAADFLRLGVALLALDEPDRCLLRGEPWILGPEAAYERLGDVNNVAFPYGYTLGANRDQLNLYYGAADTSIALATGSASELLRWLDQNGTSPSQA